MISVRTNDYVRTHRKEPRGTGYWAFRVQGENQSRFFYGTFTQAKRECLKALAGRTNITVEVLG